jgi:mono/diheme cytochrome c family protein
LKRGSSLEQIYLTIATGVSGTPMPAFAEALAPVQIWAIVFYLESLVPAERRLSPARILGEEQQGRMALHMSGMMGMGRQR